MSLPNLVFYHLNHSNGIHYRLSSSSEPCISWGRPGEESKGLWGWIPQVFQKAIMLILQLHLQEHSMDNDVPHLVTLRNLIISKDAKTLTLTEQMHCEVLCKAYRITAITFGSRDLYCFCKM